jgi:non-heme chloroperoxidase
MSPVAPFLLRSDDNPEGIPASVFDGFVQAAKADTPAWMKTFLDIFFSTDSERDASVSDEAFQANWNFATVASARSAYIMRHTARKD